MGKNVEVKASLSEADYSRVMAIAKGMSASPAEVIQQTDTFFNVPHERLKLREFGDGSAELIAYNRCNQSSPKLSDYIRTPIDSPVSMKQSLTRCLGVRGVIKKRRELFMIGQTRIHFDRVSELGAFVELEVVLKEDQSHNEGILIATEFMNQLALNKDALVSEAYIDLLEARGIETVS